MEFDETPIFWYPCIALVAWIDFNSCIVEIRSSERRENLPFLFSPFLPFVFLPLYLPFLLVFSIHHFIFNFIFLLSFLSFSLFFIFLFSSLSFPPSPFCLDFSPFLPYPPNCPSGETCHPFLPLPHVITTIFLDFLFFSYFAFPLIPPLSIWLIMQHSHKCTTWLFPCVTPLGCHVAST